jgi:hypothetical protein
VYVHLFRLTQYCDDDDAAYCKRCKAAASDSPESACAAPALRSARSAAGARSFSESCCHAHKKDGITNGTTVASKCGRSKWRIRAVARSSTHVLLSAQ